MKKKILEYSITTVIGLAFVSLIIFSKNIVNAETQEVFKILTDAFFAVGVVISCMGLLVVSYNGGTFDMLGYGMIKLVNVFKKDVTKLKYKTFYDYHQAKHEEPMSFWYMIIIGLAFIGISLLFLVFYYN